MLAEPGGKVCGAHEPVLRPVSRIANQVIASLTQ
jgi:hypothetical protein